MIVAFILAGDKGSAHDQQANKKKILVVILESEVLFCFFGTSLTTRSVIFWPSV